MTKQGVLTISGKATEPITHEDDFYGWIDYVKNYNDVVITKIIVDIPSGENLFSLDAWFEDEYDEATIKEIIFKNIDISRVTDMSDMFAGCSQLQKLNVGEFDTSSVTDMSRMFRSCESLQELDISGFDTSNVTDMDTMFGFCSNLQKLNMNGFDTSSVM